MRGPSNRLGLPLSTTRGSERTPRGMQVVVRGGGGKLVPDEDLSCVAEGAVFNVILQEKTLTYYWVVVRSI